MLTSLCRSLPRLRGSLFPRLSHPWNFLSGRRNRFRLLGFFLISLTTAASPAVDFGGEILPLLKTHCLNCHSTEKEKGDLDLERFTSVEAIKKQTKIWEQVLEQLELGEMPPRDEPPLDAAPRKQITDWIRQTLDEVALAEAGDPGPVVLRRLSNVEYTWTLRDLTGISSLDPAREFPTDSAAGEGFTNTGAAMVMSPSLVTKYLDAAKQLADHLVLLPDGIGFSEFTSARDQAAETLAEIRDFYNRYTVTGGGSAVDLQGIKFNTADGGVLPLEEYFAATLAARDAAPGAPPDLEVLAKRHGLNGKYFKLLFNTLNDGPPSLLMDRLRARWKSAPADGAAALTAEVSQWQQSLWHFAQVGHIGKKDGPPSWQVPVTPVAESAEVRMKLPPPDAQGVVTFYVAAQDAGDGSAGDRAVFQNARLTAEGRADIPLHEVAARAGAMLAQREKLVSHAAKCLAAVEDAMASEKPPQIEELAARHQLKTGVLAPWLAYWGFSKNKPTGDLISAKTEKTGSYDFIKGWSGENALGVLANSSDNAVEIPGLMLPHGIAVHPAPGRTVTAAWTAPADMQVSLEAAISHAHPACGNGTAWKLERRRGSFRLLLESGVSSKDMDGPPVVVEQLNLRGGDLLTLAISPQGPDHTCDLTAIGLKIVSVPDGRTWDLAADVSPDILAGNPHPSGWQFFSEPEAQVLSPHPIPPGSLAEKWLETAGPSKQKTELAHAIQDLLAGNDTNLKADSPDGLFYGQIHRLAGTVPEALSADHSAAAEAAAEQWGATGAEFDGHNLTVHAPQIIQVRLPAGLAEGYEFAATARLHPQAGGEGSVQLRVLTERPDELDRLTPTASHTTGTKSTWTDGALPSTAAAPVLVAPGSPAEKRITTSMEEFRQLFPAALCYSKIVPVDEVVTLTLYYREDEPFRRLLLTDTEAAELDRLWAKLRYVSQDALQLVDAFEQLWQYATQDASPEAFEPMREPIRRDAEAFRQLLVSTRPVHLEALIGFAGKAWRRPLQQNEKENLRSLYQNLIGGELTHEAAIRLVLARILIAPAFLYRSEACPPDVRTGGINPHELATRLSYFLWASTPDDTLRQLADSGQLGDPGVLTAEVRRMLQDPKVRRLATEFGCQWLHIRDLDTLDEKSERHFPTFASLRGDLLEEAVLFFTDFFQENRPVLSLLQADHSFVSPALANHYQLTAVPSGTWQRMDGMRAAGRGGILGLAATLAKQSGASRTSPILRGNWLSEVVLGEKLPRPPKGVPILPDEAPENLTERQLTERHSGDPKCAGCHLRIDPFGFALEGFDAIGRKRENDASGLPVNVRSTLPDGYELEGLEGIRGYLTGPRRPDFLRQFCRKLLGYALGRAVQLSDRPLLDRMLAEFDQGDPGVGRMVEMIVSSPQFQQIRGTAWPAD